MKKKPPFFLRKKFMGGFVVAIMVLSLGAVFGTDYEGDQKPREINGKWFYPINQAWFTYVDDERVGFQYLPDELSNISSTPFISINTQKAYIIIDPSIKNIDFQSPKQRLASILFEKNIVPINACNQEEDCPDSLPIKNCKDINVPGIFLKSGLKTAVYIEKMCFVIEADTSLNLIKASEKFIYQLLKII